MGEDEYEAKTKNMKRVLYIEECDKTIAPSGGAPSPSQTIKLELKEGAEDWLIESVAERLTEISATPLSFRLAGEVDIEVKVKQKRGKRK